MKSHIQKLKQLEACTEAVEFAKQFNDIQETLENTERGDWILWLAINLKVNKRKLTLAKALCAETVIHLMEDERSIKAVEVAKQYGYGNSTDVELHNAADAAADATYVANAAYAAADAAYVANAANAAAYATAIDAANATAIDAANAAYAAKKENQYKTAKIALSILRNEIIENFKKL